MIKRNGWYYNLQHRYQKKNIFWYRVSIRSYQSRLPVLKVKTENLIPADTLGTKRNLLFMVVKIHSRFLWKAHKRQIMVKIWHEKNRRELQTKSVFVVSMASHLYQWNENMEPLRGSEENLCSHSIKTGKWWNNFRVFVNP